MISKKIDSTTKGKLRGIAGRGDKAVINEINRLMLKLPPHYIDDLFVSVKTIAPMTARKILPRARLTYNEFFPVPFGQPTTAAAEFMWCAAIVARNLNFINSFNDYRQAIEKEVLDGNNAEVLASLDLVDKKFGKSLWSLELRFAVVQDLDGLKGNKELLNTISESVRPSLIGLLAFYISIRNEDKSTVGRIVRSVKEYIESHSIPEYIALYIRYRLLGEIPQESDGIASILSIDKYASVIDCYDTFVELLLCVCTSINCYEDCKIHINYILSQISNITNDDRINCITNNGNITSDIAYEANYQTSVNISKILLAAKNYESINVDKLEPFLKFVLHELMPILARCKDRSTNTNILFKKLLNYKSLILVTPLSALLMRKVSRYEQNKLFPSIISIFNIHYRNLSDEEQHLEAAFCKFREEKYTDVIDMLAQTNHITNEDLIWESRRLLIEALVLTDNNKEAAEITGSLCADNPFFATELPLVEMLKGKKWRDLKVLELKTLAICLNIYCDHYHDDNGQFNLRQCVGQLYQLGIRDDIVARASSGTGLNSTELCILKDILIEDNLTLVSRFSSSDDLINERLSICQVLLKVDTENTDMYQDEIKELSLKISMKLGMQKVDQNRVFVDFHGIKRWAEKEHRESFNRWAELSEIDTTPVPDSRTIFHKIYENASAFPEELLVKPVSQADQLLLEILSSMLNRFLNDPKDGLNSYLSLRVRHGSLEGFLRAPFAEEGLLTEFDQDKSKQVFTEQMIKCLLFHCGLMDTELENILGKFTVDINECLEDFVKNKLRIKSDTYPEGLIKVHVSNAMFNLIKLDLRSNVSFETLIDTTFTHFVIWTNYSLNAVRDDIAVQVGQSVENAIETLRSDFSNIHGNDYLFFVRDKINRGYLAFQKALEKAVDWFQFKPTDDYTRLFSIDEVLKIAIQMTKNVCPGFEPDIDLGVEGEFPKLHALTLNIINDVIVIILGNVHKHANIDNNEKIIMHIQNLEDEKLLKIIVKNKVASHVINGSNQKRVDEIRNIINKGDHINILPTEGGSGLIKLSRLIPSDQGPIEKYLSFGFDDENYFSVSVAMPFKIIHTEEGTDE